MSESWDLHPLRRASMNSQKSQAARVRLLVPSPGSVSRTLLDLRPQPVPVGTELVDYERLDVPRAEPDVHPLRRMGPVSDSRASA